MTNIKPRKPVLNESGWSTAAMLLLIVVSGLMKEMPFVLGFVVIWSSEI